MKLSIVILESFKNNILEYKNKNINNLKYYKKLEKRLLKILS